MITIEITSSVNNYPAIENCIKLLNTHQEAFHYKLLRLPEFEKAQYPSGSITTSAVYDVLTEVKPTLKGVHPYIVVVLNGRLDGKKYGNLFGSMQEVEGRFTGNAITTTFQLDDLIETIPIETYLILQLISFAVRFVVNKPMIHQDERFCLFHVKINKRDMLEIIRNAHISQKSKEQIKERLEEEQIKAFEKILKLICEIAQSATPQTRFWDYLNSIETSIDLFQSTQQKVSSHLISNSKGLGMMTEASISNGVHLFLQGSFLDSVKVIAPIIEDMTNKMLVNIGENPSDRRQYAGLFDKIRKLEAQGKLPSDLVKSMELTMIRNKVLHGEYTPTSDDFVMPLAINCLVYLDKMITSYKAM